jgi:hypothetical protein
MRASDTRISADGNLLFGSMTVLFAAKVNVLKIRGLAAVFRFFPAASRFPLHNYFSNSKKIPKFVAPTYQHKSYTR